MSKKTRLLIALMTAMLTVSTAGFAACGKAGTNTSSSDSAGSQTAPSDSVPAASSESEKPAPESIEITNANLNPKPGVFELTAKALPENAEQAFTAVLLGEHTEVSLVDNEVAIAETIADGYEFTVEIASAADPSVTAQKTFVVDNRPPEGLHITTVQKEVDAQVNGGKLQLTYTMIPEAPVVFSLEKEAAGVSVTEDGLVSVDGLTDNGTAFTVIAEAETEEQEYRVIFPMTVKNEIEREISTEAELRAIWTGNNAESVAHMKNFYKLTDNIRLTSPWKAIGFTSDTVYEEFNGKFNGNGYTISDFNMNAGWNSGFIYYIGEKGVVENLALESGTGEGEGLSGMYSGPFAGWCFGTIQNCLANVRVVSSPNGNGVHQPIGSFVGTIGVKGKVINCIALGQAVVDKSGEENPNADYASGFVASVPGTLSQCLLSSYALEGSVQYIVGRRESNSATLEQGMDVLKSFEAMTSASTYAEYDAETGLGFDRSVWRILDGALPCLKNEKFVEPASLSVTVNGEIVQGGRLEAGHGSYAFGSVVADKDGATDGVSQSVRLQMTAGENVAEGAFILDGSVVKVNAQLAKDGDVCTVTISSALNPSVAETVTLVYRASLAVLTGDIPDMTYTAEGNNTLDLSEYVEILGGSSSATLVYEIVSATEGVGISGSVVALTSAVNNTASFKVKVTVTDGDSTAESEEIEITVTNLVPKQIASAEDFLAIWTGDNAESRLHMHNNYVLTADIYVESGIRVMGRAWESASDTGYGLFGTFDGAGHTISWPNVLSVGWNSGLFPKVEASGVVKNLALKGAISGAIAGPIGLCYGTVKNCFFDVAVTGTSAGQPSGSAVAALCASASMENVLSIGQVTGGKSSAIYGKEHDTDKFKPTAVNCYALAGTVTDEVNVKTEAEMKTAATFADWNDGIWYIVDGAYPLLKTADFAAPSGMTAALTDASGNAPETQDGRYVLSAGSYTLHISVLPLGAAGGWTLVSVGYDGAEGGVTVSDDTLKIDGGKAMTGETFTLLFRSAVNPAVTAEISAVIDNGAASVSFVGSIPDKLVYAEGGTALDLTEYVAVNNAKEYTLSIRFVETATGVSAEGMTVKLDATTNNTARFSFVVVAVTADGEIESAEASVTIVNTVPKKLATAEDFLAVWTGDNEEFRLHMHNNYIMTADIYVASGMKSIGVVWTSAATPGYGLFGTFDSNGHTLSWGGELAVSWNNGVFAKIEAGGVVKNLAMKGGIYGVIAGPIGLCYGTVENCIFDCSVRGGSATQPCGSAVAAVCGGGVLRNVVSLGTVTGLFSVSGVYGKTHDETAANKATIENCYALAGTVTDEVNVKTESEMKTAASFEGWDLSVWEIADGEYPKLKAGCSSAE